MSREMTSKLATKFPQLFIIPFQTITKYIKTFPRSLRSTMTFNPPASLPSSTSQIINTRSGASMRPTVLGLYGISGAGKSFMLKQLKDVLSHDSFMFVEGAEMISSVVPGGLGAFQGLSDEEKNKWRQLAIDQIAIQARRSNKTAIVTGHFMFWSGRLGEEQTVWTVKDAKVFTHIIYLDVAATTIADRTKLDKKRLRPEWPVDDLDTWQRCEIDRLRQQCQQHGILFSRVHLHTCALHQVAKLAQFFQQFAAIPNATRMVERLVRVLSDRDCVKDMILIDADKTLAAEDTGDMFWNMVKASHAGSWTRKLPSLKELFSGPMGYSETAFVQATLLYEEAVGEEDFDIICSTVARQVTMHPEFVALFELLQGRDDMQAVVVTCGIRRVWEKVLEQAGFSKVVKVIGGGRISDGIVVAAQTKADIVNCLRHFERLHVWAIGDSPLDLPMLEAAHDAIVVTGTEQSRSLSMDAALAEAIETRGLKARQVLLPCNVSPRLGPDQLPVIFFHDLLAEMRQEMPSYMKQRVGSTMLIATDKPAAKLLASPTRDANLAGVSLRDAHRKIGRYLALEYVSELLGLEEHPIPHVQGHEVAGHRLRHEGQTTIVAMMRGGEEMAFGVNDVFPRAMFVHAKSPGDVACHHVETQRTLILVDSVINSGKSVADFIGHVLRLDRTLRIIVVAGVVQAAAVAHEHGLAKMLRKHRIDLVALRRSQNSFTGTRTTDTGNRLFNTVHLA